MKNYGTSFVFLVQTVDQDFASVVGDVSEEDHCEQSPVPPLVHRVWERHEEHALKQTLKNTQRFRYFPIFRPYLHMGKKN